MSIRNFTLVVFFYFSSFLLIASNEYKPGYFINNQDKKVNCLIEDTDSRETLVRFRYRIEGDETKYIGEIDSIKEFSLDNSFKYIRYSVDIEKVGHNKNSAGYNSIPVLKKETLFLKQLVAGKATLFTYVEDDIELFFYSVDGSIMRQLLMRYYRIAESAVIRTDKTYLAQLQSDLQCNTVGFDDIVDLSYSKPDLIAIFRKYNLFYNPKVEYNDSPKSKGKSNLFLKAGLNYATLNAYNISDHNYVFDFPWQLSQSVGVDFEYIIPYYHDKWSLLFSSQYERLYDTQETFRGKTIIQLNFLHFSFGTRRYWFLREDSKVFINVNGGINLPINSKIDFESYEPIDMVSRLCASYGVGYTLSNTYTVEVKYRHIKDLTTGTLWKSNFHCLGLHIAYNFLYE